MSVLATLAALYDRLADDGQVPAFGYSAETLHFLLELRPDGSVARLSDQRTGTGKARTAPQRFVPASFKRPGTSPRAFFLWDNSKFVFGLGRDKGDRSVAAFPDRFAAFAGLHRALLADTNDAGLNALLRFLDGWVPDPAALPAWWDPEVLELNVGFRLAGSAAAPGRSPLLHDRPAARRIWEARVAEAGSPVAMCLASGAIAPVARLHPAIKGVWGAQSSGASLVSFNLPAFESYGKEQGDNAPVSQSVAFAYGTALNWLLRRDSRNRVQVGDASVVFWADASTTGADNALAAEIDIFDDLEPFRRTDAGETATICNELENSAAGRPPLATAPRVDPRTRFHILGLSPNAARLSVRFWLETTFGDLKTRLAEHRQDLRIEPPPLPAWKQRPSVFQLVRETALQEKADAVQPLLAGEVLRAVLTGGRYPRTLLASVLLRLRAGDPVTGLKAAICKACIVRDARLDHPDSDRQEKEALPVSLDRTHKDPAYRLGRLFAVLENIQRNALGRVNASIRDRYFGAASATPAGVFPLLLRGSNHHLSTIGRRGDSGLARWFETEIADILDGFDSPDLPRHLTLEQQGRFAVGYYHQRATRKGATDEATAETGAATDLDAATETAAVEA